MSHRDAPAYVSYKGELLCWLRLGWLDKVCVYLHQNLSSMHRLGLASPV